jgi:hypothetical protein
MGNNMNLGLIGRISHADKYFKSPEHDKIVTEATDLYTAGKYKECEAVLDRLPTTEQLFDALIEKLHGKSVYKTLKAIREGKAGDTVTNMTGLSSLMTHVLIEMKQGRREYGMLIPIIYEQLGKMVYSV